MSTEEKILKLVQRLHAKTSTGEIAWERTAGTNLYQTAFPNYTVKVYPIGSGEDYGVSIADETGTILEYASDVEMRKAFPQAQATQLIREIYRMARRQALGVDSALDSLLVELGG